MRKIAVNSPVADASTVANEELKADGRRLDRTTIKQLICDLAYSPPLPPHQLTTLVLLTSADCDKVFRTSRRSLSLSLTEISR